MRPALRHLTGGLALALGLTGALAAAPAQAAGSPPVTVDDKVRLRVLGHAEIDVLANDSDPDGDELAVCRIGKVPRQLEVEYFGDNALFVYATGRVSGTYTFTYYACDFETLVPGTVTVIVPPPPGITVAKLPNRPGRLKVKNPADYPIRFVWAGPRTDGLDGKVWIRRESSVLVRVRRHRIIWAALGRHGRFLEFGRVRGIKLPPGTRPPSPSELLDLRPADRAAWQRAF